MKKIILIIILMPLFFQINAQGFAYGIKGGLTLGFQKWNNYDRAALPRYNGSIYIESLPQEKRFSVLGQLGYHIKGSRIQSFFRDPVSQNIERRNIDTEFKNLSLILGAKSAYTISNKGTKAYYLFGVRGDYNLNYNTDSNFVPFNDEDVNKFTYGFSFGGGMEFPLSDYIGLTIEAQIHPDARPQVFYPQGKYVYYSSTGDPRPVGETKVFNTAFEITIGLRFLRIVEYVED